MFRYVISSRQCCLFWGNTRTDLVHMMLKVGLCIIFSGMVCVAPPPPPCLCVCPLRQQLDAVVFHDCMADSCFLGGGVWGRGAIEECAPWCSSRYVELVRQCGSKFVRQPGCHKKQPGTHSKTAGYVVKLRSDGVYAKTPAAGCVTRPSRALAWHACMLHHGTIWTQVEKPRARA